MKKLLITPFTLFIFGITAGQTVSLHPTLEVTIDDLNPNSNDSDYPDFLANSWTYQGTPFNSRSLMQFDFSSIPNNAIIISARLSLYGHPSTDNGQLSDPLSGSNASTLRRVASSWNQNTITWNNQPPVTTTDDAALAESTSPMEDYLNIDIKNMVVDMINNGNYGLEILLDTEAYYRCLLFATTYNSDTTVFPTLVITYTTGCINLVLQPDSATGNDVGISSYYTPVGYGEMDALAWTIGGTPYTMRSLMNFDLTSIPPGAVIQSASLTLYYDPTASNGGDEQSTLSGSNAAWLQRITSSWNQNTVTWNNQPSTTTLDEATLPTSTSETENYTIDVTTLIQDEIDSPATSFGFFLKLQDEQYYRALVFATSKNPDSTLHPKLEICYTLASAPLPVASFQSSDSILCTNDCVVFTNQSSNATSWQWLFPGATPDTSSFENPSICYFVAGNYNVTLIASNANGSDTLKFNDYIKVSPTPPTPVIIQTHDTLICSIDTTYSSYQWYYYSTPIPNATNTFLVASFNGNYNVKVTSKNGCSIAVGINVILGVNEMEANVYFNFYPNPATNQLIIHTSSFNNDEALKFSIINVFGQEALPPTDLTPSLSKGEGVATIDVSKLSAGMYFLQMKSESGSVIDKFVKE